MRTINRRRIGAAVGAAMLATIGMVALAAPAQADVGHHKFCTNTNIRSAPSTGASVNGIGLNGQRFDTDGPEQWGNGFLFYHGTDTDSHVSGWVAALYLDTCPPEPGTAG